MIHINKTEKGYTVSTISSSDGKDNLSSSGKQNYARKDKTWENIVAQMKEWNSGDGVYVQDDCGKFPVVYLVRANGTREISTDRVPESTPESRKAAKKKPAKKSSKKKAA